MASRIYLVEFTNETKKLVTATSQWQAIRHYVQGMVTAKAATAKDVAAHMSSGGQIEEASTKPQAITDVPEQQVEVEAPAEGQALQ